MVMLYRLYAYLGLASVFGALLFGFRHNPNAPPINYAIDIGLYLAFGLPHLVATRSWFKNTLWGTPYGSQRERQVYITISVALWLTVYAIHLPVPGPAFVLPQWVHFIGVLAFILAIVSFFEGVTFPAIDGLLGVPGSKMTHSHGDETPLLTEGAYASVRHPMYRAALMAGLLSLLIYPNAAQLLWAMLIGGTFVVFIPIEEKQLIVARGDAYRNYQQNTPYRILRGIW